MRLTRLLACCLAFLAASGPRTDLEAQIALGAHASVIDVRGATWGGGARVVGIVSQSRSLAVALEGVGEYLSPPCGSVDCTVWAFHANVLVQRSVSVLDAYLGGGFVYEDYTLESNQQAASGTDWGVNLLIGSVGGNPGGVRPMIEARWSIMHDLLDQIGLSFGLLIPLG
jgi:hypothetical protein